MRAALTPRSLRPWRDAERTSMRLPESASATRTTMFVGEAHPKALLARLDAACRGIRLDDRPAHLLRCRERSRERLLGRERERQRGKIGITALLHGGGFGASIGRGLPSSASRSLITATKAGGLSVWQEFRWAWRDHTRAAPFRHLGRPQPASSCAICRRSSSVVDTSSMNAR